jgi:glycosyltransferase involved in cell wall biosynthesis
MRSKFEIPKDSIVFSRLGGIYSWDIPFASESVKYVLNKRDDIWFMFAQTPKFIDHPRAIFIDKIVNTNEKRKFINTSDAFLHARHGGESFGMACAEYSFCNKPVITYFDSPEKNHIHILGERGIYYRTKEDLIHRLLNFKREFEDYNCYKEFSPKKVMEKFHNVFLRKLGL